MNDGPFQIASRALAELEAELRREADRSPGAVAARIQEVRSALDAAISLVQGQNELMAATRAEAASQASQVFQRGVLDSLSAHVAVLDQAGTIVAVNQAWREFAQANPPVRQNVCEGANYLAVCAQVQGPDAVDAARIAAAVREVLAGRLKHFELEYPCHNADQERWFCARVTAFPIAVSRGVVIAHENITARRRAEQALRQSEERFRAVVQDQTEIISRFRRDGTITFVNDVYCRFFGQRAENLIGNKWQPRAAAEDLPHIQAQLQMLSPAHPVVLIENRVCSGTGELRWMEFVNRAFFDDRGDLAEIQSVGRDITQRKEIEAALRAREEQFRNLVANSLVAVILGTPEGRVLSANAAACAMFGRSEKELMELGRDAVVDKSDPRLEPSIEERMRTGRFHGELTFVRRDGTKFPADVSSTVYREPDGHWRTSLVIQDITLQKAATEEVMRSRETLRALTMQLEQVRESERARIAREIHDELGHAMTDLKLDLAWLARRLEEAGFTGRCAIRKRIAALSKRADENAQTIRRITTELRPAVLDALGLSAAIEWQTREFEERTGIQCEVVVPESLPALQPAQTTAVFRVFQEILSNVARHAQATRVVVKLSQEAGQLALRVEDNGCGIALGDPAKPTAFGLLGIHERMKALHGEALFEGQPNQGTTVTIRLPLNPS